MKKVIFGALGMFISTTIVVWTIHSKMHWIILGRIPSGYHAQTNMSMNNASDQEAREWFSKHLVSLGLSPHPPQPEQRICINHKGRLGNILFQFAGAYSLSKFYGKTLVIDSEMGKELKKIFNMEDENGKTPYQVGNCEGLPHFEKLIKGFQDFFLFIKATEFNVFEYFESWGYFYHEIDHILRLYTFKDDLKQVAQTTISKALNSTKRTNSTAIGIHVRRGDIAAQQKVAPWSYFKQAMDYYRHRFQKNAHFFVASNDRKWVTEHFRSDDVTFLTGSPYEDMAVLSECEHFIMSIGSFSYWAAMLTRGTVTYYLDVYRSLNYKYFPAAEYFLPQWIPIRD